VGVLPVFFLESIEKAIPLKQSRYVAATQRRSVQGIPLDDHFPHVSHLTFKAVRGSKRIRSFQGQGWRLFFIHVCYLTN
jgi:hypothetical protein